MIPPKEVLHDPDHVVSMEERIRSRTDIKFRGKCSCGEASAWMDKAGYISAWSAEHRGLNNPEDNPSTGCA